MKNRSALHFVLIIGIANFFADFTYEGARGIVGPFLGSLGASAAIIGFVAGLGELMGCGLRSVSGYFADKSHRHWAFAFLGYAVNMLAVPALALAGSWPLAATLVVSERVGRGIRKPTVEAMLSYADKSIGAGWVFGLNEALDQAGATVGPLLVALILYLNGGFRAGFGVLLIPGLLFLAPFVFLGTSVPALIGMVFWGIGMSAQGSLFQAMLTGVIPPQKRSTAFGLFDTGYGIAWFVGSAVMGLLYDRSVLAVALFSVILQLAALPIFFVANKRR